MVDIDIKVSLHCLNLWNTRVHMWVYTLILSTVCIIPPLSWSKKRMIVSCSPKRMSWVHAMSQPSFPGSFTEAHLFESSHWSQMLVTRSYTTSWTSWYVVHHSKVDWLHLKLAVFDWESSQNVWCQELGGWWKILIHTESVPVPGIVVRFYLQVHVNMCWTWSCSLFEDAL